ncbi:MAG: peptidoglycan bridge formation glycyltransferase FemA/FemB family protein, partial [candidate division Zixibacteria bacterium]|nr:peptidoglycan bridge formation glycyltransferase FemA/FemB family protein [candidate division Zixibacteria bacterium]
MLKLSDVYIRPSSPADSANWDDYVDNSKIRTYAHRWGWSEILEKSFGITPYYYVAESDGKIVGILPTALMQSRLFGTFLISLPWLDYGGALADNDEIAAKLIDVAIESAQSKGCRFFEMRAVRHRLPNLTEKTDKREFLLELREGEETVWKSFDAKARNQVRKAEKAGLSVEFGKLDKFNDFYTVFSYNMRDLGTPVWPKNLFKEIFHTFPDDTEFAVVKKNDEIIAAGLLIHYKDYSGVPSASAYRKYLKLCPNNLLYWEVIKRCISRGSSYFDFG